MLVRRPIPGPRFALFQWQMIEFSDTYSVEYGRWIKTQLKLHICVNYICRLFTMSLYNIICYTVMCVDQLHKDPVTLLYSGNKSPICTLNRRVCNASLNIAKLQNKTTTACDSECADGPVSQDWRERADAFEPAPRSPSLEQLRSVNAGC